MTAAEVYDGLAGWAREYDADLYACLAADEQQVDDPVRQKTIPEAIYARCPRQITTRSDALRHGGRPPPSSHAIDTMPASDGSGKSSPIITRNMPTRNQIPRPKPIFHCSPPLVLYSSAFLFQHPHKFLSCDCFLFPAGKPPGAATPYFPAKCRSLSCRLNGRHDLLIDVRRSFR